MLVQCEGDFVFCRGSSAGSHGSFSLSGVLHEKEVRDPAWARPKSERLGPWAFTRLATDFGQSFLSLVFFLKDYRLFPSNIRKTEWLRNCFPQEGSDICPLRLVTIPLEAPCRSWSRGRKLRGSSFQKGSVLFLLRLFEESVMKASSFIQQGNKLRGSTEQRVGGLLCFTLSPGLYQLPRVRRSENGEFQGEQKTFCSGILPLLLLAWIFIL